MSGEVIAIKTVASLRAITVREMSDDEPPLQDLL